MQPLDYASPTSRQRLSGYTFIALTAIAVGLPWAIFILWYLVPRGPMRGQNEFTETIATFLILIPFIIGTVFSVSARIRIQRNPQQPGRAWAAFTFYLNLVLLMFLLFVPVHVERELVFGFR